jgi:phage shock protein C
MSYDDYDYSTRRGLYRSRDGILAGVCAGLADYFDLSVFWVRVIVVIGFLITGFWPVGVAYIIAAFMMKKEPYYRY